MPIDVITLNRSSKLLKEHLIKNDVNQKDK